MASETPQQTSGSASDDGSPTGIVLTDPEYNWFAQLLNAVHAASTVMVPGPGAFLEKYPPTKELQELLRDRPSRQSWMRSMSEAIGGVFAAIEDPQTPPWAGQLIQLASDLVTGFNCVYTGVSDIANKGARFAKALKVIDRWKETKIQFETIQREIDEIRRAAKALVPIVERLKRRADFEREIVEIGMADILSEGTLRLTGGRNQRDRVRIWLDRSGVEVFLGSLGQSQADELVTLIEHARDAEESSSGDEYRGVALYNKKMKAVQEELPIIASLITRVRGSTANAKAHYIAEPALRRPILDERS